MIKYNRNIDIYNKKIINTISHSTSFNSKGGGKLRNLKALTQNNKLFLKSLGLNLNKRK